MHTNHAHHPTAPRAAAHTGHAGCSAHAGSVMLTLTVLVACALTVGISPLTAIPSQHHSLGLVSVGTEHTDVSADDQASQVRPVRADAFAQPCVVVIAPCEADSLVKQGLVDLPPPAC